MEPRVYHPIIREYSLHYAVVGGYETKEPRRGSDYAAGFDVFIPEPTYQFLSDYWSKNHVAFRSEEDRKGYYDKIMNPNEGYLFSIKVNPHESVIVPTGLRFNIPEGTYLEVANRGSMAAKEGLVFGAHIIDEDYNGNVFINLINTTNGVAILSCGQKFAQIIHKEYIKSSLYRISEEYIIDTARGSGALGSTGK